MKSALKAPVGKSGFVGTAEVTDPGISSHRAQGQKTSLILTYSQLDMMSCFQQSADPLRTNPSKRKPMLEVMENLSLRGPDLLAQQNT